jgi:putative acetyltransferase
MIKPALRDQTDTDVAAVHALVTAAYRGLPHASGTEPFIMDALWRSGGAVVALVAEDDTGLVGQIAFSAASIFGKGVGWHALGPLAVRPDRQRQGIGSALIAEGFARLRARRSAGCIVAGDPAYYQRFGFRRVPDLHVPGIPDPYVMALPFDDTLPSGAVDFHEAFAATESSPR